MTICLLAVAMGATLPRLAQSGPTARAAEPAGMDEAILGSPVFKPTAHRPVGWRGDWTGRFPGAVGPIEWSRRIKGLTGQIRYQSGKPAGEPGADSRLLEYFTIKDWLVIGPFAVDDPVRDIDKDFLGGEAGVEPDADAKVGDLIWKPLRAGIDTQSTHYHNEGTCGDLNVDFVYCFGNLPQSGVVKPPPMLNNRMAYAHTYLHSPVAGEILLRVNYTAAAIKVQLNGQAVTIKRGQETRVSLRAGWNRLLVKVASSEAAVPEGQNAWVSRWRFAAYLEPVPPVAYESRNIRWMTRMTGRSMSQPIVVGERLYVGSGMTDLLCLDKRTGRILWMRSNTPYDAMAHQQRAAVPEIAEKIEPLARKLDALNDGSSTRPSRRWAHRRLNRASWTEQSGPSSRLSGRCIWRSGPLTARSTRRCMTMKCRPATLRRSATGGMSIGRVAGA